MPKQYQINFNLENNKIADLIVTDMCNMSCPFCIASYMLNKDKKTMSLDEIRDFAIPVLKSNGITHVGISGGEPSLLKHLPDICKMLKDNGFQVNIATNGYDMKILSECSFYVNYISLSLNFLSPSEINAFCKNINCQLRLHGLIWKGHYDTIEKITSLCKSIDPEVIIDFSTLRTTNMWASQYKNVLLDKSNKFIADHVLPENEFSKIADSMSLTENGWIGDLNVDGRSIKVIFRDKTSSEVYEPTDRQLVVMYDRHVFHGFNDVIEHFMQSPQPEFCC